jgi:TusA-related sulfurtransferase
MNAEDAAPQVLVDGGDKLCVALLLELRAAITGLPIGTVVHVIATDPAAPLDLPAWCHMTGHHYLGPVAGPDRPAYALRLTSSPPVARSRRPWHTH